MTCSEGPESGYWYQNAISYALDIEESVWQYDERAGAYYLHHFYKTQPEIGMGKGDVVAADDPCAFVNRDDADGRTLVTVHNLSAEPRTLRLLTKLKGDPGVLLSDGRSEPSKNDPTCVRMDGYGYCWFTVT